MPTVEWNKDSWGNMNNWEQSNDGEIWSSEWGNSNAQWAATLYPRIQNFIPAGNILEIAPGLGRWTKYLLKYTANAYRGVDLVSDCVESCRKRFSHSSIDVKFIANDGKSLCDVADLKYDFIFSFDSLVHAGADILESYITQILGGLLNISGVCFLHHSNAKFAHKYNTVDTIPNLHQRDGGVSAELVAEYIERNNGKVLCQEIIPWGVDACLDALTLFCHKDAPYENKKKRFFMNPDMMQYEASYARRIFLNYTF